MESALMLARTKVHRTSAYQLWQLVISSLVLSDVVFACIQHGSKTIKRFAQSRSTTRMFLRWKPNAYFVSLLKALMDVYHLKIHFHSFF